MSNDKNAQELLKWGLAHSTSTASGPSVEQISADIESGRRPDLADPKLYEAIMGTLGYKNNRVPFRQLDRLHAVKPSIATLHNKIRRFLRFS